MKTIWMVKHSMLVCLTASFLTATAQKISIGRQSPDYVSSEVINYRDTVIRLSDFSGKLVVIDFWNHSCLSCMKDFDKLDSLQKKFNGRLQIILANNESKDSTLRFFAKYKKIRMPALPLICSAWNLWSLFVNDKTPYQLWLDGDRTVQYITGPYNLTVAHISSFLEGEKPVMANYASEETVPGNTAAIPPGNSIYYSTITHCNSQTGKYEFEALPDNNRQSVHMCKPCYSVKDLYKTAYTEYGKYKFNTPGRVILEMTDTYPFIYPEDDNLVDEWKKNYSYTYDLLIPASKKEQRYKFMQQDIGRYFGLSATIEKRKLKCFVLMANGDFSKLRSKGGKPVNKLSLPALGEQSEDTVRYMKNEPFKDFVEQLGTWIEYDLQVPFINKTGFTGNIDIRIKDVSVDPIDLRALRKELQPYHLKLAETTAWMDVLVIKPKK
jgi:thiol-disulfide isomerase/thioredoxin